MEPKKQKKKFNSIPLLVIAFFAFLILYLYPFIADKWNAYVNKQLIVEYQNQVQSVDAVDKYEKEYEAAVAYNKEIAESSTKLITSVETQKSEEYENLLNMGSDGMMGYIEIPRLNIEVPIYHYSDDAVLEKGIGHVHGSSLPVGGENTHSILTGHRGLPSSKLFTDLDKMEVGDKFYIHILGKDLAYDVISVNVVLPAKTDSLVIEDGKDLITLVTCTPYGVNTHRLLVTGSRIPYDIDEKEIEKEKGQELQVKQTITPENMLVFGLVMFVLVLVMSMVTGRKPKWGD